MRTLDNATRNSLRAEIINKIKSGDIDRLQDFTLALKGEITVCRNFADLLKVCHHKNGRESCEGGCPGGGFGFQYDEGLNTDERIHAAINNYNCPNQNCERDGYPFVWIPDEKGKEFEQFLDTLKTMYEEAGDWNEADKQRIQRQINRNI